MRILWVKPGKLLPLDRGGKIRSYNILRHLCRDHLVTCLSYYGGKRDHRYEQEVAASLPGAITLHTPSLTITPVRRAADYLRLLPSSMPFVVANYMVPEVQQLLSTWLNERRFEVAVCDFLACSPNFPPVLTTPTVLFQHNVESVLWRRKALYESNFVRKLAWKLEAYKMERYEREALNRFHRVIAVSERDREYMSAMTDPARIFVVPTGVDLQEYQNSAGPPSNRPLVVFTGSMDWRPNIDAVQFFCREVWPRILSAVPDARFRIVGRRPYAAVEKLACDTIEVTGTVPSIVDHLRQAAVVVVPLRIGGGTRLKIYEAMAMGKAVVSTSVGAEGLDVEDTCDIMLADDPSTFSERVITLLRDAALREYIGREAAKRSRQYDWSVITQRFAQVLEKATALSTPTPVSMHQ